MLNRRVRAYMKAGDVIGVREWKDARDGSVQALIEEDVEEERGQYAPLKDPPLNADHEMAVRICRIANGAGVPREHRRNDADRSF